ncbi:MAG: VCBS repeat-containing protein [Nitrospirae bacterium]|nr:VCBS repeat-containing protein [Nitrospirota bacterium]
MRDDVVSFFRPLNGKIISISEGTALAEVNDKSQIKKGMRLDVLREGLPFVHPVTKEPLGVIETPVGKVEIREIPPDTLQVAVVNGNVREGDKLRLSETKVRMLFYQRRDIDWSLAESYYRMLKDTGRFEIIDTAIEPDNDEAIVAEAKRLNVEVVLILSVREEAGTTMLKQRLFWADDSVKFFEDEKKIFVKLMKELRFGEEFFGPQKEETRLYVDLPFGVRLISVGDIDGDGKAELLMSTGKDVRLYAGGELSSRYEIKGTAADEHLWLDTIDMNRNGRSEIVITMMRNDTVSSRIYELMDSKFSVLWEGNLFLRRMGNDLIAQAYEQGEGYKGPVFAITLNEGYKKTGDVNLPQGVNIYDFTYMDTPGGRLILAYDDEGHLNLYDDTGNKVWRSKEDYGGFLTTFKRMSLSGFFEKGEWAIKDRLSVQDKEVLVIKRVPVVGVAKGLGYSKSQLKGLWWTGVSMEERDVAADISGNALDYAIVDDRLVVLSKPLFGIKLKNILKGESLLGSVLFIYSLKGR